MNIIFKLLLLLCFPMSCSLVGLQINLSQKADTEMAIARLFYQERHMHKFDQEQGPLTGVLSPSEPMLEELTSALTAEATPTQTATATTASPTSGQATASALSTSSKPITVKSKLPDTLDLVALAMIVTTPATTMDLDTERTIPCEYCGAMFAKESHLEAHSQVHQREKELNLQPRGVFKNYGKRL